MKLRTSLPPAEWPQLSEFLAARYRPDLALRWRPLFEWQYQAARHGGCAAMITAWDGDRLIGTLGYVPLPAFWGDPGEPVNGAWAMNWMVDPAHRTGIGWLMMRKLQDLFPVVFSVDASTDNVKLVEPLGWTIAPVLPRYVRVLDAALAGRLAAGRVPRQPAFTPAANTLAALDLRTFEPDWSSYAPLRFGVIRSRDFLRWRYAEHPRFEYVLAASGEAARPAVCVYRIEAAFDRGGDVVANVGRIVEFFHPSDGAGVADAARLLDGVLERLAAAGCAYADVSTSAAEYGRTLVQCGWTADVPGEDGLPNRLTPIDPAVRTLNIEFGVRRPLAVPAAADAYVTRGDCDADRPALVAELMPDGAATAAPVRRR